MLPHWVEFADIEGTQEKDNLSLSNACELYLPHHLPDTFVKSPFLVTFCMVPFRKDASEVWAIGISPLSMPQKKSFLWEP